MPSARRCFHREGERLPVGGHRRDRGSELHLSERADDSMKPQLLLVGVLLSLVPGCRGDGGGVPTDKPTEELIRTLKGFNLCRDPGDCWDLGYVKGIGCHVPVSRQYEGDARLVVSLDAEKQGWKRACGPQASAKDCEILCDPFLGYECVAHRCVHKRKRPNADVCYSQGVPIDCAIAIQKLGAVFWRAFDCRKWCGGGHVNGMRAQMVFDRDGGADFVEVDYFRCENCPP